MFQGEDQNRLDEVELDEVPAVSSFLQDTDCGPSVAEGATSLNAPVLYQGDKCWDEAVSAIFVSHYFLR